MLITNNNNNNNETASQPAKQTKKNNETLPRRGLYVSLPPLKLIALAFGRGARANRTSGAKRTFDTLNGSRRPRFVGKLELCLAYRLGFAIFVVKNNKYINNIYIYITSFIQKLIQHIFQIQYLSISLCFLFFILVDICCFKINWIRSLFCPNSIKA